MNAFGTTQAVLLAADHDHDVFPWFPLIPAIFLSAFVMISQNRADAKREALAEHQWQLVQAEEKQNEELLEVSRQILEITTEIHRMSTANPAAST